MGTVVTLRPMPIFLAILLLLASVALQGRVEGGAGGTRTDFLVPPHLSWQHDPQRSMTVAWATRERDNGSAVRLGRTPALEFPRARADTTILVPGHQGFRHAVELRDLTPNTTYYYDVGSENLGWSETYTFTTAPAGGPPFTFIALADMGTTPEAAAAVRIMASENYSFSLHAGDISYAGGNQKKWDQFFKQISPMASRHPYMTVVGNHENETREKLVSYTSRFVMPPLANPADPARSGLYYSFNYSAVHFVALKADVGKDEYPTDPNWDSLQTAWLQHDLRVASQDSTHPWIVVYFHYPLFSSGSSHGSWMAGRRAWSPLFDRHHVALVITGHDHDYERTYPVSSGGAIPAQTSKETFDNPPAPVYLVTGGGGESTYGFDRVQPWSAVRSEAFEFVEVRVEGGVMALKAVNSQDGSLVDCFQIVHGGPPINLSDFCHGIRVPPQLAGNLLLWGGGVAAAGMGVVVAAVALRVRRRRRSVPR